MVDNYTQLVKELETQESEEAKPTSATTEVGKTTISLEAATSDSRKPSKRWEAWELSLLSDLVSANKSREEIVKELSQSTGRTARSVSWKYRQFTSDFVHDPILPDFPLMAEIPGLKDLAQEYYRQHQQEVEMPAPLSPAAIGSSALFSPSTSAVPVPSSMTLTQIMDEEDLSRVEETPRRKKSKKSKKRRREGEDSAKRSRSRRSKRVRKEEKE
eukprot:gnl/Dysnectes_brevis/1690_a1921_2305.p1 GENE.gnl/Dysnectes_brevis/1690_a1921_2305~~gnl/Dysnectes_brevis/1690_a1921_2305.p1  ORF type:complete len:244 (-),score=81.35 gnl/Dysnectes_brevis/1690_a1921_2305:31-675(-)